MGIFAIISLPFRAGFALITILYWIVLIIVLAISALTGVLGIVIFFLTIAWTIGYALLLWSWRRTKWTAEHGVVFGKLIVDKSVSTLEDGADKTSELGKVTLQRTKELAFASNEKAKWTLKILWDQLRRPYYAYKLGNELLNMGITSSDEIDKKN